MTGRAPEIEAFIARWTKGAGGAERANYAMFLSELCVVLNVPAPDPAGEDARFNDYVFERSVLDRGVDAGPRRRIDLYRKNSFVLEAKQSRLRDREKALFDAPDQGDLFEPGQGKRGASRIFMDDLRDGIMRERLRLICTDPHALDPARESAGVTREVAARLAEASKVLEKDHPPEEVALFLMSCLVTIAI